MAQSKFCVTQRINLNEFKNNSKLNKHKVQVEDFPSPLRFDYTTTGGSPTTT